MSRARALVLDTLEEADGPRSLADLSETTGLHANTLREHLEALADAGLVHRELAAPAGRGRPARLYRADRSDPPVAEYAGLASTLAATLHRTSDHPVEAAVEAGADWGHELARTAGRPEDDGEVAARRQVVSMLRGMGFDPEVDPEADPDHTTVRLRACPLLDAATRFPNVVCGVHRGIAVGALREYDADDSQVSLLPFAEPGACLLHLGRTTEGPAT